jgi:hypothetical protein
MKKWMLRLLYCFDRKERAYVSDAGRFLKEFDIMHPQSSASQRREILKHAHIFERSTQGQIDWS